MLNASGFVACVRLTEVQSRLSLNACADVVADLEAVEAPRVGRLGAIYGSATVAAEDPISSIVVRKSLL